LKRYPEDPVAVPRAAEVALHLQDWPQARAWCRKWSELAPSEIAAWKGLRTAGEKVGDLGVLIVALEALTALQPADPSLAFAFGNALAKNGDRVRALEYLVRAVDLKPGEKAYGEAVRNHLEELAEAALKAGKRPQAAEWYGLLLDRAPGHRKASLYYGLSLAQGRDYPAAVPRLREGLKQSAEPAPVLAEAWRELGLAEAGMGNFDPARAAFSKALGLNPKDAAAANGLLDAVETLDKKEELPGAYAAVLRVDSNHVKALAGLSGIRLAGGGYEEAAQLLRRLTAARPEDAAAFADYGQALQALNRTGEAKDAFAKAYDLGDHRPLVVGSLVRQHRKSGTLDAALPSLEEWRRQSPEDDVAAAWAADLAEKSGDWHKAEAMWALAWQAKPGQIRYLEGLGRAYARSGENEFAAELLAPHAPQLASRVWCIKATFMPPFRSRKKP
jgi:tetratricopeptide (TPR) repeat protein